MQEWWIIWLPGMADKTKTTNTRYDRPSQSLAHGRKHFGQWASVFELLPPMATLMSRCKPCKILQTMESSQYVAGQTQQKTPPNLLQTLGPAHQRFRKSCTMTAQSEVCCFEMSWVWEACCLSMNVQAGTPCLKEDHVDVLAWASKCAEWCQPWFWSHDEFSATNPPRLGDCFAGFLFNSQLPTMSSLL